MSCIRANIPITIIEGGTFNKTFQWKTGTPSLPVDLTGYTAHMQVRAKIKDVSPLLIVDSVLAAWSPDCNTGIYFYNDEYEEHDPDDVGKWRVYIKDEDTKDLCSSHKDISGVYDLFLYSPSGEALLQVYGVAAIIAAVTRDG
jgi:hypothetical protein